MDNLGYDGNKEVGPVVSGELEKRVELADCAFACCKLRLFNRLRSPIWLLAFLSLSACVRGFVAFGLVTAAITSIERRFGLKSSQSGMIVASQEIGSLLFLIPASHFGGKLGASKPRWIAAGLFVLGLGSFVWTIPHFATGLYLAADTGHEQQAQLCNGERPEECVPGLDQPPLALYRLVFILGQLMQGVGSAPFTALGTSLLDESVSKRSSPLYIAVFQVWFVVGPALGYLIGGSLLLLHTDLVQDSSLNPASSLWVGAWWPGFLVAGFIAIVAAFCLSMYPKSINRKRDTTLAETGGAEELRLFPALHSLATNSTFTLLCLASCGDGAILGGLAAFLPKFVGQQYGLSTQFSAQLVGLILVPAGGLGTIFSGWIIKRFNLTRTSIIKILCIGAQVIGFPILAVYLMTCPSPHYAGLTTTATGEIATPDCRDTCSCSDISFDPVCGSNSIMYLSPCHAGCSSSFTSNFTDCDCINDGSAVRVNCSTECPYLIPFVIMMLLNVFISFITLNPVVIASMRSVPDRQRSLAIGLQLFVRQAAGNIPGPIILGYFLDKTCWLWDKDCGGESSCLAYDKWQLGMTMMVFSMICRASSIVLFFFAYQASKVQDQNQPGSVSVSKNVMNLSDRPKETES
eukprot:GFUD01071710.1.p1 GENE.GFUD01071710.1~~GFUD01071710.1.p1  ORF type:complete len:633 (+),score=108.15 GFUD01071710.1:143-2041(+)